jgi:hypothetical protein
MIACIRRYFAFHICCILAGSSTVGCRTATDHWPVETLSSIDDVADTWIGFDPMGATYYKLILSHNQKGALYSQYFDGTLHKDAIFEWNLARHELHCRLNAVNNPESSKSLRCRIERNQMEGTLLGVGGWSQQVLFRRERDFKRRVSVLFEAK